jgi:hypothetical protein
VLDLSMKRSLPSIDQTFATSSLPCSCFDIL